MTKKLTKAELHKLFDELPTMKHWLAIKWHEEKLSKIYSNFAKSYINKDLDGIRQRAFDFSEESAVDWSQEVAFGEAENLQIYLEYLTDPETDLSDEDVESLY
jgi:hypothetical protein